MPFQHTHTRLCYKMTASHKTSYIHMNKAYNEVHTQLQIKTQLKISSNLFYSLNMLECAVAENM